MSVKHPVISVTGSSGAGTSTAKVALEHIFHREQITAAIVEGDCFHKFGRIEFKEKARSLRLQVSALATSQMKQTCLIRLQSCLKSMVSQVVVRLVLMFMMMKKQNSTVLIPVFSLTGVTLEKVRIFFSMKACMAA